MVNPVVIWITLFAPLAAALIIVFFLLKHPRAAGLAALTGILASFAGALNLFIETSLEKSLIPCEFSFTWIRAGSLSVDFGFLIDPLSILMLLVVSGVGSTIFTYSIGYMKGDSSEPRYFASLALFAFSMLGIVLANNFLVLFVFWELVAVSSYLLIGFWFEKPSAANAAVKAFLVNRLADFGFLLGILWIWHLAGAAGEKTFVFSRLAELIPHAVESGLIGPKAIALAILLVFCGVAGKSAQFPLYIWLPDAMEGPTPVSALIHAATMVAAGVYLLARTFFLIELSPGALHTIVAFGCVTAFLAAGLAIVQNDIKKILAYSTVSQLGFMVTALGLGSATVGMYHLTTHAFFKALLFLGSGAMIHALHTQDIWEMGGLLKRMPVTAATFLIGTLALCGIWPLSGFFSKDEILALAFEHNLAAFAVLLLTAGLTAFYMTRLCWIAVIGPVRQSAHSNGHGRGGHAVHEAPGVMKYPLVVLAVFAIIGGFIGIPEYLEPGIEGHPGNLLVPILATASALLGILGGSLLYSKLKGEDPLKRIPAFLYKALVEKYYLDVFFLKLADGVQKTIAGLLFKFDWNVVIGGLVNGTARLTRGTGSVLRRAQTGRLQQYAMMFVAGLIVLMFFVIRRG